MATIRFRIITLSAARTFTSRFRKTTGVEHRKLTDSDRCLHTFANDGKLELEHGCGKQEHKDNRCTLFVGPLALAIGAAAQACAWRLSCQEGEEEEEGEKLLLPEEPAKSSGSSGSGSSGEE